MEFSPTLKISSYIFIKVCGADVKVSQKHKIKILQKEKELVSSNPKSKKRCLVTWTSGQLGSSMTAPALAASAPLRKVGPRFTVTEANLHMQSVINPEKNGKETPIWGVAQFGEMSYPGS